MRGQRPLVPALGLMLLWAIPLLALAADQDGDSDVDVDDIQIILAARNTPASGPTDPKDLDGDGIITILDARLAVLVCTRPLCAVGNNPPVASDDAGAGFATDEDTVLATGNVLGNDSDPDGDVLAVESADTVSASGAVVTDNGDGTFGYDPTAAAALQALAQGVVASDTFDYVVGDGAGGSAGATVTIAVTGVDDAPVAVADVATVAENDAANAIDVLANDTDIDGGPKTIASATDPANGTVVVAVDGLSLTYQSDADYCNDGTPTDDFSYTLAPGGSMATVAVTVTCADDPPVAVDDAATVTEDDPATGIDVLSNDTDVDGGPKTIASATDPANGTVVVAGDNLSLTYQPDPDYCNDPPGTAPDTFDYSLNGGSTATVSVTVSCVEDDPVAVDDSATVVEGDPASAIDVLANDTDIDGGPKTIASATDPANGTVVVAIDGLSLTYQPDADYCNDGSPTDDFSYTLAPGGSMATVSVTVTCADDPPVAVADSATVTEDDPATAIDVLANDTDADGGLKTIASASDPANGTVVVAGDNLSLTYQPDPDYCNDAAPTDDFMYTLSPGGSTATVAVTVTCVDDDPVAVDDLATVAEDDPATAIDVLANDTDVDGGTPMTIASAMDPANGTVVVAIDGLSLTYQPDTDYCNDGMPTDDFSYSLAPGGAMATVAVTVTCSDDAPTAVADAATVAEDDPATMIDVLANDTDIDGGPKTIASATDPANGTVVVAVDGLSLTYQPDPDYCNDGTPTDDFGYTLTPGGSMATVAVTVSCTDDPPVAVDDAATVAEDDPATTIDVLANDTDLDGGLKTIASATDPANGTVVVAIDGLSLSYQPDADYCNDGTPTDDFTYTLTPGGSMATVSVTVTCSDDAPTAVADAATVAEDDPATAIDVLANDADIDGGPKTIASATDPANGTVVVAIDGLSLTYQPDPDYCNDGTPTDDFGYTLTPGGSMATVAVTVSCGDDPPVAVDDAATVAEDDPATAIDVLANDTDIDGGPKTIASATDPANGTVVVAIDGLSLTYQPDADYCNDGTPTDDFGYTLNGGSMATVAVTVTCSDDPPVAVDDAATVAEDDPATTIDVLANDTDADGGAKTIAAADDPANGTVVVALDGLSLTYQPDPDYCNDGTPTDDFGYTLTPGGSMATVAVTVTCVDDDPVAVDDAATVAEDDPATVIDVLANDTDSDGGPKTIAAAGDPANGTVVVALDGLSLTYQPDADYCNDGTPTDDFGYTLNGGSMATVAVTVTCVDDDPVAVDDAAMVLEDAVATTIDVLANDTDPDGGPKTIASASDPANGTVVVAMDALSLTYQPDPEYCNDGSPTDDFSYTLSPGGDTGTVAVTVTCVDDPPVAVADSATVDEDSLGNAIDVLANDTDADGGPKTVMAVQSPSDQGGTVLVTGMGTGVSYTPAANYCNNPPGTTPDSFSYTLNGGSMATVSVTVNCINDPPVAGADSFAAIGNTELYVDLPGGATPRLLATTASTFGVLDNDADPVEGDPVSVAGVVACADVTAPFGDSPACATSNGGSVIVEANGRFSFRPGAGMSGDHSFQYQLSDGTDTDTATVTITINSMVWYVNNSAAVGNGTSTSPFNTLAPLNGAGGAGDSDAAGHYLFVHFGDGTATGLNGGLELEANQRLRGEHAGLSIPLALNGNPAPAELFTAVPGNRPLLHATAGNGVSVTSQIPIEIVGLSLQGSADGIGLATVAGALGGSSTLTISDNRFNGAGVSGLDVDLVVGTTGTLNLEVLNNFWGAAALHSGAAVDIGNASTQADLLWLDLSGNTGIRSGGTAILVNGGAVNRTTVTGFADNAVSGDTTGVGVSLSNLTFDAMPGGGIDPVAGGTLPIGVSGNPVTGSGLNLTTVAGNLFFTDLDVFAGTSGLNIAGAGAFTFGVTAAPTGTSTIDADAGPAVNVSNAALDLRLASLTSDTSTSGISLTSVTGQFSAPSGSAITKASGAGTAFSVASSNLTLNYGGTLNVSSGAGVSLVNTGASNFSGAMTLSTGANTGFSASGGGTVTATGTTSTITSTTGTALTVNGTTIGAAGLTFRSISAGTGVSGPTNGIVLNNTGSLGGLTVTGTGGAGSGGTIQRASGDGISLINTRTVSLDRMNVTNNLGSGIRAELVNGLTLTNLLVTNNSDSASNCTVVNLPTCEAGIFVLNLTGAGNAISSSTISGSFEDNLHVENRGTNNLSGLTLSNNTVTDNNAASGNVGIHILSANTASITATATGNTLHGNRTVALRGDAGDSSNLNLTFTSNNIFDGPGVNQGNQGIEVAGAGGSHVTFDISNNFVGKNGAVNAPLLNTGINVSFGGAAGLGATVTGNISGNTVHNAGAGLSGSGIRVFPGAGDAAWRVRVDGNIVTNVGVDYGIFVGSGEQTAPPSSTTVQAGVTNNNVSVLSGALDAIRVQARNNGTMCARIDANTTSGGGALGGFCGPVNDFCGLFVRQANAAVFNLETIPPPPLGNLNAGDARQELIERNPAAATVGASAATNFVGVAANTCNIP